MGTDEGVGVGSDEQAATPSRQPVHPTRRDRQAARAGYDRGHMSRLLDLRGTDEGPSTPSRDDRPFWRRLSRAVARRQALLWWLHSLYALAFGVGVMWLGSRHYGLLRVTLFYVAFIWLSSLLMPLLAGRPSLSPAWRERLRLLVNYFNRNFYQQLLFFLLPVYYASATWSSANMLFVAVIAACAVLSTLDIVYDRHLSIRPVLTAVFFAFNLFACANALLPVVWHISNGKALPASAAAALIAFLSIVWQPGARGRRKSIVAVAASAALLAATVLWGRPFIPPAPLRVLHAEFGTELDRRGPRVTQAVREIQAGWSGSLFGLTAIRAPLGLEDRLAHRWYENGRLVYASPFYRVQGGREEGFRLWTRCWLQSARPGRLRLDVVTEAGQLVGRAEIKVVQLR
jgi:hypothetical protein